ncbi:MAG: FHA domain-containing protein [Oscillospiraceae bacterium]|nr:FHA domain-containing protein [Oscillospiraceae bacterium]
MSAMNNQVAADMQVTVFDAFSQPVTIRLNSYGKDAVTFGRADDNDIVLTSRLVSRNHGRFIRHNGRWFIEDLGSTNGLLYNHANIHRKELGDGEFVRVDDGVETVTNGVLFVFADGSTVNKWNVLSIENLPQITIGRDNNCNIVLPHVSVSQQHARICKEADGYYLYDNGSANGVFVNGLRIAGRVLLHEKDVITITNSKLIFTAAFISYCYFRGGISVDTSSVVIERGKPNKRFITCNNVSLNIKPGELVAIIGGSGAGKSTLLNAMCGYLKPASGQVFINGIDLYENFASLQKIVGYVPQSDIVYDDLTVYDMLMFTAKMRLPKDVSEQEREAAIQRAIATVELEHKKDSLIKALSGGQRKRASIAVELLSDPNLLFLDEPASGLDPGTERNLMQSLRGMADQGKTVILVTHSTLQLKMCDKVVFMGMGGNLCFCGHLNDALKFFGVDDVVDVYNMITKDAKYWSAEFAKTVAPTGALRKQAQAEQSAVNEGGRQAKILRSRYTKLILNDKARLRLLLLQAPLLGFLISLVANGRQYETVAATKSLMFALSCSAFWIGILNAIQEICKERNILKREYMTGLSLGAYIRSKATVLGAMCLVQTFLLTAVFGVFVGMPEEGVLLPAFGELLVTNFLTAFAAACTGLFISAMFDNADKAMTVAPILLMPQILFSGIIFKLGGATEYISWFTGCRWSMEALGSTCNFNGLTLAQAAANQDQYMPASYLTDSNAQRYLGDKYESMYAATEEHVILVWGILLVMSFVFLILAKRSLKKLGDTTS